MLPFFPPPYPDETLESRCARFAAIQGYSDISAANVDLFANRHYVVAPDLPYGLSTLIAQLPSFHKEIVSSLCQQATLLPFYAPFLSPNRVAWLQIQMASNEGHRIHSGSGLMASRVPYPQFLRYCPTCVTDDRQTVGEAYWHRAHQTAGSYICYQHNIPLLDSPIAYHQRLRRHEFTTLESALRETHIPKSIPKWIVTNQSLLHALAQDIFWLLEKPIGELTPIDWHSRYWSLLIRQGSATYTKRLRIQKLHAAFLSSYPPELLESLRANLNPSSLDNWLLRLIRQPNSFHHPIYHLLLIHFLGYSAASLISYTPPTDYFRPGPWPCLNTICRAFKKRVIKTYTLNFTHQGLPAATFTCPICGLAYRRIGPDEKDEELFSFTNYVAFGKLWESELKAKWEDETLSLLALSRHLGVDPRTVKRHAQRLKLVWPRPHHRHGQTPTPLVGKKTAVIPDQLRHLKRTEWLYLCQQHPDWTTKQIRQEKPSLAAWLWRHDQAWLKTNQPVKCPTVGAAQRVDWTWRDLALALNCISAALSLLDNTKRPRRLSRTAILRQVSRQSCFEHNTVKLPIATNILIRLLESRVEAALRRIRWVKQQHKEHDQPLKKWQLIRKAGVGRLKTDPAIREALATSLISSDKETLSTVNRLTSLHSLMQTGELPC